MEAKPHIELIPIAKISVLNPRDRNRKGFRELVESIASVGLKRPITVSRSCDDGEVRYDLVCGQGRLEAFAKLGQTSIPSIVIEDSVEECMVKSLVENCARRQHRAIDLLNDIGGMRTRGHTDSEIAAMTGLSLEYVRGVGRLLARGEQRLLRAVEAGVVPITVAVQIAEADDVSLQDALREAYETKLLRGKKLLLVKQIIESRRRYGRKLTRNEGRSPIAKISRRGLIDAYREDTARMQLLIRKADAARSSLAFIVRATHELMSDEQFVSLLRSEGLSSVPSKLSDRMKQFEPRSCLANQR